VIMSFIHQTLEWPDFTWDAAALLGQLAAVRHRQGRLLGRMEGLGLALQSEASLATLTGDVAKSSAIEGEVLDLGQVIDRPATGSGRGGSLAASRDVEGIVEVMLDATQHHDHPLTSERLFGWHAALFPTGCSGLGRITVGAWRTPAARPMQVVSGPVGRERVHFKAPAAERLEAEMRRFLVWFNAPLQGDPVVKAALAHSRGQGDAHTRRFADAQRSDGRHPLTLAAPVALSPRWTDPVPRHDRASASGCGSRSSQAC